MGLYVHIKQLHLQSLISYTLLFMIHKLIKFKNYFHRCTTISKYSQEWKKYYDRFPLL